MDIENLDLSLEIEKYEAALAIPSHYFDEMLNGFGEKMEYNRAVAEASSYVFEEQLRKHFGCTK